VTALALWLLAGPAMALPAWINPPAESLPGWSVGEDGGPPGSVTIRPSVPGKGTAGSPRVLVLYSGKSSAYDIALGEILVLFAGQPTAAVFTVVNVEGKADRAMAAVKAAEEAGIRLVFAVGSTVTQQLHERYRGGALPVVTVCAKDPVLLGQMPAYTAASGNNFAYTSLNAPIEVQYTYLKIVKPALRNIAILYSFENASAIATQLKPLAAYARRQGMGVQEVGVNDAQAAAQLAERIPAAIAEMRRTDPDLRDTIFWVTGSTSVFTEIATINRVAGSIPVISAVPDIVSDGDDSAVLSIGIGFDTNAQFAARYAAEILAGRAKAGELPVGVVTPPDIAINFRRARAVGLRIPFSFVESAGTVFGPAGTPVRVDGHLVATSR
jgi:putative ABC transport system substrate-binding protein